MAQTQAKGSLVGKDGKPVKPTVPSMFGESELTKSTNDAVYDDRNGKSTIAATFTLPLILVGGHTVTLTGRVYGRLQKDGSVGFDVSMPRGIVMSAETRDAGKTHVQDAIIGWSGRPSAWKDAYDRLTAQPKPKGSKAAVRSAAMAFKPESEPESETEANGPETGSEAPQSEPAS